MMWNGACAEMSKLSIKAICDAGPIIHLDELDCLHLLSDFHEIILSQARSPEGKKLIYQADT